LLFLLVNLRSSRRELLKLALDRKLVTTEIMLLDFPGVPVAAAFDQVFDLYVHFGSP
jgi:hypothetical protein